MLQLFFLFGAVYFALHAYKLLRENVNLPKINIVLDRGESEKDQK